MLSIITELTQFAPTQSDVLNFNSYGLLGNKYLAANENGIYSMLDSSDAAGTGIDAYFVIHRTDFGTSNQKHLRAMYVGYESTSRLIVTITVDENWSRSFYLTPIRSGQKQHGNRVPLTRDLKGRYFEFKFQNVSGGDFSIDHIRVKQIKLNSKPRGTMLGIDTP